MVNGAFFMVLYYCGVHDCFLDRRFGNNQVVMRKTAAFEPFMLLTYSLLSTKVEICLNATVMPID